MKNKRTVLFDLDDTLINSDDYCKACRRLVLQQLSQEKLITKKQLVKINHLSAYQQKCLLSHGAPLHQQLSVLCIMRSM